MIEVNGVSKSFGQIKAVDHVSFKVERGEVLGFLGPNGAGKSTTMRMITGFISIDDGSITVGGHDVDKDPIAAKKLIGYLPENAPAYSDMRVVDFLGFAADVRGIRGLDKSKAIDRAIEMCFLQRVKKQSVDTLSKGYKHRTCLAQAIIHDPEVLILDEPTDGLDPNQKHEVRQLIREMGKTKAIVFSTHILEEVEAACTRAIIIDRGRTVADGTPAELLARSEASEWMRIVINRDGVTEDAFLTALRGLVSCAEAESLRDQSASVLAAKVRKGGKARTEQLAADLFNAAHTHKWQLMELSREHGRLDEVFRAITTSDVGAGTERRPAEAAPSDPNASASETPRAEEKKEEAGATN